jgi:DNA-binding response OmpR family regulator
MSVPTDLKILLADDDATLLDLMTRRLNKMGYKVDLAEDGLIAKKLVERNDYDLIITDIYMPNVTGLDLLKQAKERDPHVQVVVITAGAALDNAIEALNLGAFAYLTKPFDHLSVFDNVISRALDYRRLILANLKMANVQRRRGDMLEDEVAERVLQLRQRQRNLIDILGSLPDGVVVVGEGGRIILSSPVAEKWLARELRSVGQPIKYFLEKVHDEWAENSIEVEVGSHALRLLAVDLPSDEDMKRKVVIIREIENGRADLRPKLLDPFTQLKQGLGWLYQQQLGGQISNVLKHLAYQVSELERLSGVTVEMDDKSQQRKSNDQESEPEAEKLDSDGQQEQPPPADQEPELLFPDTVPAIPQGPPVDVEAAPSHQETIPAPKKLSKSGLLRRFLPIEIKSDPSEGSISADGGRDEKLPTPGGREEIPDISLRTDGKEPAKVNVSQEQIPENEGLFDDLFADDLLEDEVDAVDSTVDHSDTPIKRQDSPQKVPRSKTKNWPPARPSEAEDFEDY